MAISSGNSFGTRDKLHVGAQSFDIHRLELLEKHGLNNLAKLPFSLRILLENLLRCEDNRFVHAEDIKALANWKPGAPEKEIAFMPARVLLR
jgi:aconitate hydratase